jgi:formamidopyrimidine-DNA glycosylase
MPEGPEVKRMSVNISERIEGKEISNVQILGGKWIKKPPINILEFQDSLPSRVSKVGVKGKTIQIYFENGWTIWNTLGMSGGWKDHQGKHSHFKMDTSEGRTIWFDDTRRFGNLIFMNDYQEVERRLGKVGTDLLGQDLTLEIFLEKLNKRPNKAISKVLMDQSVISGIGNYIKCEVLYRARISPFRLCKDISLSEMEDLYNHSKWVIQKSYEQGGATLSTYSDMDGNRGDFVFSFMVYQKKVCPAGFIVQKETTADGRTTHWVPQIQK